ncbi:MAG: isochorismatase family protein [Verrucomicrobiota bacterium]
MFDDPGASPSSTGLIVLDMQEQLLARIPDKERLIERCRFAIEVANALSLHCFFVQQDPVTYGSSTPELLELSQKLKHHETLNRNYFSAIECCCLKRRLEEKHIDHVLIVGTETSISIYQTAIDALDDDLHVTILTDCIGSRRPEDARRVLWRLIAMGVDCLPSETVFFSMLGSNRHAAYRKVVRLTGQYA